MNIRLLKYSPFIPGVETRFIASKLSDNALGAQGRLRGPHRTCSYGVSDRLHTAQAVLLSNNANSPALRGGGRGRGNLIFSPAYALRRTN